MPINEPDNHRLSTPIGVYVTCFANNQYIPPRESARVDPRSLKIVNNLFSVPTLDGVRARGEAVIILFFLVGLGKMLLFCHQRFGATEISP